MLAALLENNNNARQQPATFKFDPRASSGRSGHHDLDDGGEQRQYNIVDIIAAAATFPEFVGEDPAIRMVRRLRWISETLPFIKEAREKREAATFLAGIQLGAATVRAEQEAAEKLSIAQLVQIIDEVRATPTQSSAASSSPVPKSPLESVSHGRGTGGFSGGAVVLGLVLGGVVIGSLISGARVKRRSIGSRGA